jgi:hypothetical protein
MIDAQVIRHLLDSDLVIADLSGENPNAFYEIGIRHMAQKPIIHMQLTDEEIPFDVSLYRTLKFSRARPSDLRKARDELRRAVDAVLASDYQVDNPVTRARGQIKLQERATPEGKLVFEQLRYLQDRLELLERRSALGASRREGPKHPAEISRRYRTMYVHLDSEDRNDLEVRDNVIGFLTGIKGIISAGFYTDEVIQFDISLSILDSEKWKDIERHLMSMPGVHGVSEIPF